MIVRNSGGPLGSVADQSRGGSFVRRRPCLPRRAAWKLLAVLPHDRRRWFEPAADATPVIDEGALGGNSFDNILRRQISAAFRYPQTLPMAFAA